MKGVFLTNRNASNSQLVTIDLENPAEENWTTLIPVMIGLHIKFEFRFENLISKDLIEVIDFIGTSN